MTLIAALKTDTEIVLAADKRAHTGKATLSYNDNAVKIFEINSKVAIAGAGDGFDSRLVIDEILAAKDSKLLDVNEISDLAYRIATQKQKELYSGDNGYLMAFGAKSPLQFGFLIVGFTKTGESKIFSITNDNLTPREIKENYCQIGVPLLAEYMFSKEYKKNLSLEGLKKLAIKAITETSNFVTAVSPTYDIVSISKS